MKYKCLFVGGPFHSETRIWDSAPEYLALPVNEPMSLPFVIDCPGNGCQRKDCCMLPRSLTTVEYRFCGYANGLRVYEFVPNDAPVMSFPDALASLIAGAKRIGRKYWDGRCYVSMNDSGLCYHDGIGVVIDSWAPMKSQLHATDWVVVE